MPSSWKLSCASVWAGTSTRSLIVHMQAGWQHGRAKVLSVDVANWKLEQVGALVSLQLDDRIPFSQYPSFRPDFVAFVNAEQAQLDLTFWANQGMRLDFGDLSDSSKDQLILKLVRTAIESRMTFKAEFDYARALAVYPSGIERSYTPIIFENGDPIVYKYDLSAADEFLRNNSKDYSVIEILHTIESFGIYDDMYEAYKEANAITIRPILDIHFREILAVKDMVFGGLSEVKSAIEEGAARHGTILDEHGEYLKRIVSHLGI